MHDIKKFSYICIPAMIAWAFFDIFVVDTLISNEIIQIVILAIGIFAIRSLAQHFSLIEADEKEAAALTEDPSADTDAQKEIEQK